MLQQPAQTLSALSEYYPQQVRIGLLIVLLSKRLLMLLLLIANAVASIAHPTANAFTAVASIECSVTHPVDYPIESDVICIAQ